MNPPKKHDNKAQQETYAKGIALLRATINVETDPIGNGYDQLANGNFNEQRTARHLLNYANIKRTYTPVWKQLNEDEQSRLKRAIQHIKTVANIFNGLPN